MGVNLDPSVERKQPVTTAPGQGWLGRYRLAVISANLMAFAFTGAIVWASWRLGNNNARAFTLNILVCLLGAALGWGAGILATPIAEDDTTHFAKLAQIISAFLSGYLVSKLDRFLERALYSGEQLIASAWERTGLFVVSFLVMLIVVFINRWYLHRFGPKTPSDQTPTTEPVDHSQVG
jgi:hypothetical protein